MEYISRRFSNAAIEARIAVWSATAGPFERPTLRDVRSKALTHEYEAGATPTRAGTKPKR